MRKLPLWLLVLVLPSVAALPGAARAQNASVPLVYVNKREFLIPFGQVPQAHLVKELRLLVSKDQGKHWDPFALAPPDKDPPKFQFTTDADGLYWFTVQTIAHNGRTFPAPGEALDPDLKVVVDTVPPLVRLRPLPPRAGEVGVSWEIDDPHLDLTQAESVRLEYRAAGGTTWTPLPRRDQFPQLYWNPETNGVLEVQLHARDRAGNWGQGTCTVSLPAAGAGPPPGPPRGPPNMPPAGAFSGSAGAGNPGPSGPAEPDPGRRLVNSKNISLNFEIKDKGPSGISALELWFTQDGRSWNKHPLPRPPGGGGYESPLIVPVAQEGVYGFTLVAKSGVGLGERPPQIGDRPQVWVEVDLTKPVVRLEDVVVGQGKDKGKLFIIWNARDKNLGKAPIALSYAKDAGGPWTPIGADHIANSGRYVWSMPEELPYQFHVKVEAVDRAGNVGEAVTREMVKVDLLQPRARILNVAPAGP